MKKLLILFTLLLGPVAMAQVEVVEKSYAFKGQELDIDVELGSKIKVNSWDKNEIAVKISYAVNGGKSNDAVEVDLDDYSDRLAIDVNVSERKMMSEEYCCCKEGNSTVWNKRGRSKGCIEMVVEISAPATADVRVKSVISDVIVEGMNGNVEIETVTGIIDLSWDKNNGAAVNMKTVTGDVYTNIDFDRKKEKGLQLISSHEVNGTLNNGGKEIFLKTVTNDIYFRKTDK